MGRTHNQGQSACSDPERYEEFMELRGKLKKQAWKKATAEGKKAKP